MSRRLGAALLAAAFIVPTASWSTQAYSPSGSQSSVSASEPKAASRVPTAAELRQIYSDRTWAWADGGGGYFAPDRTFYGVVGNSAKSAFMARGSWAAGNKGDMCFQAVWQGQAGNKDTKTCFFHKVENGRVFQKKGPDGTWYVFKSVRLRKGDEYNKLASGDRIGERLNDVHGKYLQGIPLPM